MTPTVPVVVPAVPIATVFVVEAPGTPFAIFTTLPPAVAEVPPPIVTVWVEDTPAALIISTVPVAPVVV